MEGGVHPPSLQEKYIFHYLLSISFMLETWNFIKKSNFWDYFPVKKIQNINLINLIYLSEFLMEVIYIMEFFDRIVGLNLMSINT